MQLQRIVVQLRKSTPQVDVAPYHRIILKRKSAVLLAKSLTIKGVVNLLNMMGLVESAALRSQDMIRKTSDAVMLLLLTGPHVVQQAKYLITPTRFVVMQPNTKLLDIAVLRTRLIGMVFADAQRI
jgi:hypothetical protein